MPLMIDADVGAEMHNRRCGGHGSGNTSKEGDMNAGEFSGGHLSAPFDNGLAGGDIALIDNDSLTRDAMARMLSTMEPSCNVLEYGSLQSFIDATPHRVSLVLFHHHEIDGDWGQQLASIRGTVGSTPVFVLSAGDDLAALARVRSDTSQRADGVASTRTSSMETALAAIQFVQAGGSFLPLDMTEPAKALAKPGRRGVDILAATATPGLTQREREVFHYLRMGESNRGIATTLGLSENTVKVHVRNIMRKSGATNRLECALKGISTDKLRSPHR